MKEDKWLSWADVDKREVWPTCCSQQSNVLSGRNTIVICTKIHSENCLFVPKIIITIAIILEFIR